MTHYEFTKVENFQKKGYSSYAEQAAALGAYGVDNAAKGFVEINAYGTPAQILEKLRRSGAGSRRYLAVSVRCAHGFFAAAGSFQSLSLRTSPCCMCVRVKSLDALSAGGRSAAGSQGVSARALPCALFQSRSKVTLPACVLTFEKGSKELDGDARVAGDRGIGATFPVPGFGTFGLVHVTSKNVLPELSPLSGAIIEKVAQPDADFAWL